MYRAVRSFAELPIGQSVNHITRCLDDVKAAYYKRPSFAFLTVSNGCVITLHESGREGSQYSER